MTKSQLESLQQAAGREREKQQARLKAEQERARQELVVARVRNCGLYEGLEGKLSAWEDGRLWPTEHGIVEFGVEAITFHEVGSAEWIKVNRTLCNKAVVQAWLPAARLLADATYTVPLDTFHARTTIGKVGLDMFRRLVAAVRTGEYAVGDVQDDVAEELASVRAELQGACREIGQLFCDLADHLMSMLRPAGASRDLPSASASSVCSVTGQERQAVLARLNGDMARAEKVMQVLGQLRASNLEWVAASQLAKLGLSKDTVFSAASSWQQDKEVKGRGTPSLSYARAKLEWYVRTKWFPKVNRKSTARG